MKNKQMTLPGSGFEKYGKTTRRAQFLAEMEKVVPWAELCALIEPVYPKAGNGRPPIDLELMLRVYFLQQWFNLSDPAAEEALYDSASMRRFAGIDLGLDNPAAQRFRTDPELRRHCLASSIDRGVFGQPIHGHAHCTVTDFGRKLLGHNHYLSHRR